MNIKFSITYKINYLNYKIQQRNMKIGNKNFIMNLHGIKINTMPRVNCVNKRCQIDSSSFYRSFLTLITNNIIKGTSRSFIHQVELI